MVKNLPANTCQCQRHRLLILPFIHIPNIMFWRRQWQPTPVLLPEKSHGPFIHIINIMFKICQNNSRTDFIFQSMCLVYTSLSLSAAAAKSLQSCPTLCDPIAGSPPDSPVPGILQVRTLKLVAISFSNV